MRKTLLPISDSVAEYCKWYQRNIHPVYNKKDLFKASAKSMEDTYEAGSKVFGFVVFMEHMENHI